MDPWPMIEADRRALAEYLGGLADDDWSKPSLCADWTVEEVTAHMLVIPTVSKGTIFLNFLTSGFNLDKFSAKMVAKQLESASGAQLATVLGDSAGSRSTPPGLKPLGILAEVLIHSGDISLPVGTGLAFPADHYVVGLDFLKETQPVYGCRDRIAGLRLQATDADWSYGDGPVVEGTTQHLLLAMTGRSAAIDHLTGDGVDTLRGRG